MGFISWLVLAVHWQDWSIDLFYNIESSMLVAAAVVGGIFMVIHHLTRKAEETSKFF